MPFLLDTPGQNSLRRGRRSLPGHAYFISFTACDRQRLFASWDPAALMSRFLSEPSTWRGACLLAWVLMPDHFHGLLVLESGKLATCVGRAKGASAYRFNKSRGRAGPVWARAFHDRAIRGSGNVRDAARYLVGNPIRAGLVSRVGDYPFWDACWLRDGAPL